MRFHRFFTKLIIKELKYYIDFATETSSNVWWYDGQRIVFRSASSSILLTAMKENPTITVEGLSKKGGINMAATKKQLQQMTEKGYIQRNQNGEWYVFASPAS